MKSSCRRNYAYTWTMTLENDEFVFLSDVTIADFISHHGKNAFQMKLPVKEYRSDVCVNSSEESLEMLKTSLCIQMYVAQLQWLNLMVIRIVQLANGFSI